MSNFFYGVIEGFYGRQWSWSDRLSYASFFAAHGFDAYVFAPKGESLLRSNWQQPLTDELMHNLDVLSQQYRRMGVRWGVGLSPLGLATTDSVADGWNSLKRKINQLNELAPDILCILFDDVRGDIPGLAKRQLAVVDCILEHSQAPQHVVCPTYYSFDPVLEQIFGAMPQGYLQELGGGLPEKVGIFWTGNRVISAGFQREDLDRISELLGRKPVLWDNYPVNDGRKTADHLFLKPYSGRPGELREWSSGHFVNPMNQPYLSQLVLQSLQLVYQSDGQYSVDNAWIQALALLGNEELAASLNRDRELFQDCGRGGLSPATLSSLKLHYSRFSHPAAREVLAWLSGEYAFDPACLTG